MQSDLVQHRRPHVINDNLACPYTLSSTVLRTRRLISHAASSNSQYRIAHDPVLPPALAIHRFVAASSAELSGAAPYLFHAYQHPSHERDQAASPAAVAHLPRNDGHSQASADAAEHKRNDASCREACGQRSDALVLSRKIQHIDRVTGRISGDGIAAGFAGCEMVFGDRECLLHLQWRFNQGSGQPSSEMPVNVTVKEPNAWPLRQ